MMSRLITVVSLAVLASGCSLLVPYDSKFSCPGSTDYGKCTDVNGAYSEALGGDVVPSQNATGSSEADKAAQASKMRAQADQRALMNRYKEAEYRTLANLVDSPVTPVITPPKALRTLIVAYASPERTLYMPRFIFYFVNDGSFVFGDYLSTEKPAQGQNVFPNGGHY